MQETFPILIDLRNTIHIGPVLFIRIFHLRRDQSAFVRDWGTWTRVGTRPGSPALMAHVAHFVSVHPPTGVAGKSDVH